MFKYTQDRVIQCNLVNGVGIHQFTLLRMIITKVIFTINTLTVEVDEGDRSGEECK